MPADPTAGETMFRWLLSAHKPQDEQTRELLEARALVDQVRRQARELQALTAELRNLPPPPLPGR